MIVADASVVLKWALPDEPFCREAMSLRERHLAGGDRIAAPELLWYEVSNVLPFRWPDPREVMDLFLRLQATGLEIYSFDAAQFCRAMELAGRHGVTTYDACYLVLAEALRCRLVTADERFLRGLRGVSNAIPLWQAAR